LFHAYSIAKEAEENNSREKGTCGKESVCYCLSFLPPPEGWWVSRKDFL
jgi:hypothetical protein